MKEFWLTMDIWWNYKLMKIKKGLGLLLMDQPTGIIEINLIQSLTSSTKALTVSTAPMLV